MLAPIKADTSGIEEKLNALLEVFPEGVPDEFVGVISGLIDNVILVNSSSAITAGGSFDVVCAIDFDGAFYDKVMSAARALKADIITH